MKKLLVSMLSVALLSCSVAFGAGFSILEQSPIGIGRALAGMSVNTEDPASLYFNPATPAWHEKAEISLGNHCMHVYGYFHDKKSDASLGDDESGNLGGWVFIPNIYYVQPVAANVVFGLGVSATSGTRTDYNPHWIGRYFATETEIQVIDINPTLSWKVCDQFSIGVGAIIEKADATMGQSIDFSAYGQKDAAMELEGDSYAYGFSVGAVYEPISGTKLGLGYRSRMTHDLDLKAKVKHVNSQFAAVLKNQGMNLSSDASCDLNLPSMVNFGVEQKLNDQWRAMADICWSEWSVMDALDVEFKKPVLGQKESSVEQKWKDNWRIAVGTEYDLNEKWTLRTGAAFDKTPVQDGHRNPRLPDANRYWLSGGFTYNYSEHLGLNFAYTHIFFETVPVECYGSNGKLIKGKTDGSCDIISLGMTYTF